MKLYRNRVRVWDPFVRVFHWMLAASFATAWISAEERPDLHEVAGYLVLVLLGLRLLWGVVGTRHARFAGFVRSWSVVAAYLDSLIRGRPRRYLGHNPAGGWMVIVLLAVVAAAAGSGLPLAAGPADAWEDVHEALAGLALGLVCVHVAGVVVSSWLHRENLVGAMISGKKMGDEQDV